MIYLIGKHPYINLKVKLTSYKWQQFICLIDTGFSGGLSLPQKFEEYFPKDKMVEARFSLANSAQVTVNATYTQVEFNSNRKEVSVIFLGQSDSLVGVEFLDQMRFCLDLKQMKVEIS